MKQNVMHKRPVGREKRQPGCMWGLLRIFDFHQSHSVQKLLSDRRHRDGTNAIDGTRHSRSRLNFTSNNEKHKGSYSSFDYVGDWKELDETGISQADIDQASVKTVLSDKTSKNNKDHLSSSVVERKKLCEEHQKQKSKTPQLVRNLQSGDGKTSKWKKPDLIHNSKSMERFTGTVDQTAPLHGFCNMDVCQVTKLENQKVHDACHGIKDQLDEATEALVNQKFYEAQCLSKDGRIHHSKEFINALEILNSNKELFIKLLHDPNSLLFKHIQGLRNAEMEGMLEMETNRPSEAAEWLEDSVDRILSKQNVQKFSKRRHKLWSRDQSFTEGDTSQNSTQIVVLKPGPPTVQSNVSLSPSSSPQSQFDLKQQVGKKLTSPFSLKEITRKLKLAILDAKAGQHRISMDGILDRAQYAYQGSEQLNKAPARRHLGGESSDLPKRANRPLRSESWKEKKQRPLRYQAIIIDELSSPRGCNYLENKSIPYSRSLSKTRDSATAGEVQRHVSEINARDADEPFSNRPPTRSLGRLLSLPEYSLSSPRLSPRNDSSDEVQASCHEHLGFELSSYFEREKMSECRSSTKQDFEEPVMHENVVSSFTKVCGTGPRIEELNFNTELSRGLHVGNLEEEACNRRNHSPTGDEGATDDEERIGKVELPGAAECDHVEEQSRSPPVLCFCSPERTERKIILESLTRVDEDSSSDMAVAFQSPSSDFQAPNQSLLSENACEKQQQPSPVSVLEPDFTEDFSSPEVCLSIPQDIPIKPQKIHFEEVRYSQAMDGLSSSGCILSRDGTTSRSTAARGNSLELKGVDYEYVRMLLEASNLIGGKEFDACWDSSNQPLHPSIFLLVDPPSEVSVDQLLLFDCVNEVLLEMSEQSLGCNNLVSCLRHNMRSFPMGERLLKEVWAGVNGHLVINSRESPTLDHIVGADLAKSSRWMDLRLDAGCMGEEIEVSLLEDLIEEAVIELES